MQQDTPNPGERLDSWKEIAAYLGKAVRTVQRWERTDGLPVHRLGQDGAGPVFAYKSELDAWWRQQSRKLTPEPGETAAESSPRAISPRLRAWALVIAGVILGFVAALAFIRRGGPPPHRRPVPLTADLGNELQPAFSPDGRQIAYVSIPTGANSIASIHIKTIGEDSSARLTSGTAPESHAAWSPDGRQIAFLRRHPEGGARVMVITLASRAETELARLQFAGLLAWSPDGRWLVVSHGPVRAIGIAAIAVPSGEVHPLTEGSDFAPCGCGITPDMKRLIYCKGGPGPRTVWQLPLGNGLMPAGAPSLLVGQIAMGDMVLAPDGESIIYTDDPMPQSDSIFRLPLRPGATAELLYESSGHAMTPAISADQRRLVFALSPKGRTATWRLPLDTPSATPAPLLASSYFDLNPDYSPDGKRIAFHSTRSGASEIWIADRDGGNQRRLTYTQARVTATPRWSPDGNWIAYESNVTGQTEVYLVRSNGGPARRMTDHPATDAIPSWSRDGRFLYFTSDRTGRYEVWKTPVNGGAPMQVTTDGGFAAVESPDGQWLYYTQTRNYGPLLRRPAAGGASERIVPDVHGLFFAVTKAGVYFRTGKAILFWDSTTRQTRDLNVPTKGLGIGLSVSPDEKELLFIQGQSNETDLYLIDNLR